MSEALNRDVIEVIKANVPTLETHGLQITDAMYGRLFKHEHIRALFNQSHQGAGGTQSHALAAAILAYARNIENLDAMAAAVERISQKHAGLQIVPEHYPFVATALLGAIKDVLGDAATPEILNAWGKAYWFLANILITREEEIYAEHASMPGAWKGWREFVVADRIRESDTVMSFILKPRDGNAIAAHKPGQYLTITLLPDDATAMKRNYTISNAPNGEHYRLSVKKEPEGRASRWLHEKAMPGTVIKATVPAGEFYLNSDAGRPIVLLSGGVGLTPMISMLETIVNDKLGNPVHFVHGTLDGSTHAMKDHVSTLVRKHENLDAKIFYSAPRAEDRQGTDFDAEGLVSGEWLHQNTPIKDADYYLCGPTPFLRVFINALKTAGVESQRINFEFFGPPQSLDA